MNADIVFDEEKLKKYLKGTTTVGLVCKDGVVLASDTRATMGYLVSDKKAQKIFQIDDKIAITTAGLIGDAQSLIRIMKAQLALAKMEDKPLTVKATATLLANILHARRFYPFLAQLIVGGYDSEGRIYELDPVGGLSEKQISSTGSGSPVAYGVMESAYNDKISVEEGTRVAIKAVKSALERDIGTGNEIDVLTITSKGLKKLPEDRIKNIVEEKKA